MPAVSRSPFQDYNQGLQWLVGSAGEPIPAGMWYTTLHHKANGQRDGTGAEPELRHRNAGAREGRNLKGKRDDVYRAVAGEKG